MTKICPNQDCKAPNPPHAAHCSRCGGALPSVQHPTGVPRPSALGWRWFVVLTLSGVILIWLGLAAKTGFFIGGFVAGVVMMALAVIVLMILGGAT